MSIPYRIAKCSLFVQLVCLVYTGAALAAEDPPDPERAPPLTPAARSELAACIGQAGQSAGDDHERRVTIGVSFDTKGRPARITILESSGLESLDKLVMRCLFRASYIRVPLRTLWSFQYLIKPRRAKSASS